MPQNRMSVLQAHLEHDGKQIVPTYEAIGKTEETKVRFDKKAECAAELGIIEEWLKDDLVEFMKRAMQFIYMRKSENLWHMNSIYLDLHTLECSHSKSRLFNGKNFANLTVRPLERITTHMNAVRFAG